MYYTGGSLSFFVYTRNPYFKLPLYLYIPFLNYLYTKIIEGILRIRYKSKISIGLLLFVFTASLIPILLLFLEDSVDWWILSFIVIMAIGSALFAYLVFRSIYYIIEDTKLGVMALGMRTVVDIEAITQIRETNNPVSSPAASLDRLEVTYMQQKEHKILISPNDKVGFISQLLILNPTIEVIYKIKK